MIDMTREEIIEECARRAHEANRTYCRMNGDTSHAEWSKVPSWKRTSVMVGAHVAIDRPTLSPKMSHALWCDHMRSNGWTYGETKDSEKRTHPCLLPFSKLSIEHQVKDHMFLAIVRSTYAELCPAKYG
jgi:hypothetical protein